MPPKPGREHLHPNYGKPIIWNENGESVYYKDMDFNDPRYPCHWSQLGSILVPIPDPYGEDEGEYDGIWYPSFDPFIRSMQLSDGCHPITGKAMAKSYSYTENDEYKDEYGGGDLEDK